VHAGEYHDGVWFTRGRTPSARRCCLRLGRSGRRRLDAQGYHRGAMAAPLSIAGPHGRGGRGAVRLLWAGRGYGGRADTEGGIYRGPNGGVVAVVRSGYYGGRGYGGGLPGVEIYRGPNGGGRRWSGSGYYGRPWLLRRPRIIYGGGLFRTGYYGGGGGLLRRTAAITVDSGLPRVTVATKVIVATPRWIVATKVTVATTVTMAPMGTLATTVAAAATTVATTTAGYGYGGLRLRRFLATVVMAMAGATPRNIPLWDGPGIRALKLLTAGGRPRRYGGAPLFLKIPDVQIAAGICRPNFRSIRTARRFPI